MKKYSEPCSHGLRVRKCPSCYAAMVEDDCDIFEAALIAIAHTHKGYPNGSVEGAMARTALNIAGMSDDDMLDRWNHSDRPLRGLEDVKP